MRRARLFWHNQRTVSPGALTRAGLPTATEFGGIGRVTTEPAPIVDPSPMSAITIAAAPIQQSVPTVTVVKAPSPDPEIRPFPSRRC